MKIDITQPLLSIEAIEKRKTDISMTYNKTRFLTWSIVIFTFCTALLGLNGILEASNAWKELSAKSEAHNVLVGAYRGCLFKFVSGSVEECHLLVKDYAQMKGFESELPIVLEDIYSMSNKTGPDEKAGKQ